MPPFLHLRATDRTPRPWKNGGGNTYDLASSPAGAGPEAFDWRLSIAEVAIEGPFSSFPKTDRHLAVLDGTLELRFGDQSPPRILKPEDGPTSFQGEASVTGHPVGGPVHDLNLMIRHGVGAARLRTPEIPAFTATAATTILVTRRPCTLMIDGVACHLESFDAVSVALGAHVSGTRSFLLAAEVDAAAKA